jgi:hypothetical protein
MANCCGPFIVGVKLLLGGCIVVIPAGENAWNAVGTDAPDWAYRLAGCGAAAGCIVGKVCRVMTVAATPCAVAAGAAAWLFPGS